MNKFINKWSKFAVLILAAVAAALFLVVRARQPLPAPPPLPNPNGYDDFVKAARVFKDLAPPGTQYRDLDAETLRGIVEPNAEALRLVRTGLGRQSRSHDEFARSYALAILRLAKVMACEGRLLELEQQTNQAAKVYLETVKLGHQALRGGILMDRLIGSACEGISFIALRAVVDDLDAQTCREIARSMEKLETHREPVADVLANERKWARQHWKWRAFFRAVYELKTLRPEKEVRDTFVKRMNERTLDARKLMIELAARAYELEKGQSPKGISDLVPDYLRAVPIDPATGTNLVYRP